MKSRYLFIPLLMTAMLSSCAQNSIYVEGEFFDKEFLKSQLVENLPNPYGVPLLYVKAHGMNNPTEYIDASLASSDYSAFTAHDVFNYLSVSFEHIYAIKQTSKYNTPLVSKYAYDVQEAYEIVDFITTSFYIGLSELEGCYAFVYSKDGFLENEDGDKYLSNPHCIVITKHGYYYFSYNKKTINYTYSLIFDTHSSFWLFEDWFIQWEIILIINSS